MPVGRVKTYNPNTGYGFITHPAYGDIFVHCTQMIGDALVSAGDLVQFEVSSGSRGWRAVGVTLVHAPTVRGPKTLLAARAEREQQQMRDVEVGLPEESEERRQWRRE